MTHASASTLLPQAIRFLESLFRLDLRDMDGL